MVLVPMAQTKSERKLGLILRETPMVAADDAYVLGVKLCNEAFFGLSGPRQKNNCNSD
jgi:hypothetical protein